MASRYSVDKNEVESFAGRTLLMAVTSLIMVIVRIGIVLLDNMLIFSVCVRKSQRHTCRRQLQWL